jgi:hypothetical protein
MRSPVEFCFLEVNLYSNVITKIQNIVGPLSFTYGIYEVIDQFSNESGNEDWLAKFPDVCSPEPVLVGDTVFILNKETEQITFNIPDPSWVDILDAINSRINNKETTLVGLDIIGLSEDGLSYIVEIMLKIK